VTKKFNVDVPDTNMVIIADIPSDTEIGILNRKKRQNKKNNIANVKLITPSYNLFKFTLKLAFTKIFNTRILTKVVLHKLL